MFPDFGPEASPLEHGRSRRRTARWRGFVHVSCLALSASGCDVRSSGRADFVRQVTLPDAGAPDAPRGTDGADGGPDAAPAEPRVALRATTFSVELPDGLNAFDESVIAPAVVREDLNFLVVATERSLASGTPELLVGSGDRPAPGRFALSTRFPPARVQATVTAGMLRADRPFRFTLLVRLPYEVVVPVQGATVSGALAGTQLSGGLLEAVIRGEDAAVSLIDTQNDQNPTNDTPLANFLGTPDLDEDGDGTRDDFRLVVHFVSDRVELVP